MKHIESLIAQIKANLKVGDVVQLNVKNLYTAFAKDGECKLNHCEVLNDSQYYDIATEHNKFAYGNDEYCTVEQVMDDGGVLFCTNVAENKSDRFALSPEEVAIAYFGRKQEVTRCDRCGSVCLPDGLATGFGVRKDGTKHCFDCCALDDGEALDRLNPGETLHSFYLTKKTGEKCKVTNWPSTFAVTCDYEIEGGHNLAGTRTDIGFTYHGRKFYGTQYGESGLVHVKVRKNQKFDFNVVLSGTSDGEDVGKTIPVRALKAEDAVDEARAIWEPDTLETARVYLGDTDGKPVLTVEF